MIIFLSGFYDEKSNRRTLETIHNPTESQINDIINIYANHEGIMELRYEPEPDFGPYGLTMYAEKEDLLRKSDKLVYLLMLGQFDPEGDVRVRTIDNDEFPPGLAIHWGESYPSRARTRDLDLARLVFNEFARTGNVSEDIMR